MKKKMLEQTVIRALSALAQPNRLQVFRRLVVAGPDGETPGSLGLALGLPAATLSFHLKELLHAGLIGQERCGRYLIYRVEIQQMNTVLSYLTENCCQGEACLQVSSTACKPQACAPSALGSSQRNPERSPERSTERTTTQRTPKASKTVRRATV